MKPVLLFKITNVSDTGPALLSMWARKGDDGPFSRVLKKIILTGADQDIPIYAEDMEGHKMTFDGELLVPTMTIDGVTIFWPQLETSPYTH